MALERRLEGDCEDEGSTAERLRVAILEIWQASAGGKLAAFQDGQADVTNRLPNIGQIHSHQSGRRTTLLPVCSLAELLWRKAGMDRPGLAYFAR